MPENNNDLPIIGEKKAKESELSIKNRVEQCSKEITASLEKWGCTMQVNQGVGIMPLLDKP